MRFCGDAMASNAGGDSRRLLVDAVEQLFDSGLCVRNPLRGLLLLAGALFAAVLAYLLARRMTGPIALLEKGAEQIGAGHFDHKIEIATGDELEGLARRFNEMAAELAVSQERSERIARLKRFL